MAALNQSLLTTTGGVYSAGFIAEDWDDLNTQGMWIITDFPGREEYEGWEISEVVERASTVKEDEVVLAFSLHNELRGRNQIHTLILPYEQTLGIALAAPVVEIIDDVIAVGQMWQTKSGQMTCEITTVDPEYIGYVMTDINSPSEIRSSRDIFFGRFEYARPRPEYLLYVKGEEFNRWVSLDPQGAFAAISMGQGNDIIRIDPDKTWRYVVE